jgi:hypothetical protein
MITGGLLSEVVITWQSGLGADDAARRHTVRALIPAWTSTLAAVLFGAFAVLTGAAFLGQAWAVRVIPDPVPTAACGAAAALFTATSIWLTAHRPARSAARADAALRLCTARTSLALGLLAVSGLATLGSSPAGCLFAALGLAAAFASTSSGRNRRPAAGAPAHDEDIRERHLRMHPGPVQLELHRGQPSGQRAGGGFSDRSQRGPVAQAGSEPRAE